MSTKTYEGTVILKKGPQSSIKVRAEAKNPTEAKQIIEAQHAGQIKRWTKTPSPVAR